jgi:hypothetical protein
MYICKDKGRIGDMRYMKYRLANLAIKWLKGLKY